MDCLKEIAAHMLKGLMYHRDLEDYLRFIGFTCLADEQRGRYLEESNDFAEIHKLYMDMTGQLLKFDTPKYEPIIPTSWYDYSVNDVDNTIRKKYIRVIMEIWINWEKETLALYEQKAIECRNAGYENCAMLLDKLIFCVSDELKKAEELWTQFEISEWMPHNILLLIKK